MGVTVSLRHCSGEHPNQSESQQVNMSHIVQKGVFDPREYKKTEKEWARKRKSEYLGPGKYYYTREITRIPPANQDNHPGNTDDRSELVDNTHEQQQQQQPQQPVEIKIQRSNVSPPKDMWPRKKKSDLTRFYY